MLLFTNQQYKKTIKPLIDNTKNILGIDIGLNNLVTGLTIL